MNLKLYVLNFIKQTFNYKTLYLLKQDFKSEASVFPALHKHSTDPVSSLQISSQSPLFFDNF